MTLPDQPQSTSPLRAIRCYCLSCCLESLTEVKLCPAEECPLWPFRMGKNSLRKGRALSDEEKKRNAERLRTFKLSKSQQNAEKNFSDEFQSVIPCNDAFLEETLIKNGKYPTYPNFPEEDHHG